MRALFLRRQLILPLYIGLFVSLACTPRPSTDTSLSGTGPMKVVRDLSSDQLKRFKETLVKRQTQRLSCYAQRPVQETFRTSLFEEVKNAQGIPRIQLEPLLVKMVSLESQECGRSTCQNKFGIRREDVKAFLDESRKIIDLDPQFKRQDNALPYSLLAVSLTETDRYKAALKGVTVVGGDVPTVQPIDDKAIASKEALQNTIGEFGVFSVMQYSADYFFSIALRYISAHPLPGQSQIIQPSPMLDEIDPEGKAEMRAYYEVFNQLFSHVSSSPGTVYRAISKAPRELVDDLRERAKRRKTTGLYFKGQAALTSTTRDPSFADYWLEKAPDLTESEVLKTFGNDFFRLVLVINQKTGVSIESIAQGKMKEVILPPVSHYEVVRFEDRSKKEAEPDPRFPTAQYIVYLEEKLATSPTVRSP